MRNINYLERTFTFIVMFLVVACLSCSSGDGDDDGGSRGSNPNMGKDNVTDMAVTGGVESTGMTCAKVLGYANGFSSDDLLLVSQGGFVGVEYGLGENSLTERARYSVSDGRTLHITIKGLRPNTKYYYRTIVEAGNSDVGIIRHTATQIGSFTTQSVSFNGRITTGDVSSVSFDNIDLRFGSVDETLLTDETYYLGVAYSIGNNSLTSGLSDKYKRAPFEDEWSSKATYDGVTFYRYHSPVYYDYLSVSDLSSGTTVYYATILIVGNEVLCGDIKSATTKSTDDFKLPVFTEKNKGFDFIEVGGYNSITTQDGKSVNVDDLGYSYAYGVAYSATKEKLTSGLLDRFKESGIINSSNRKDQGDSDGVNFQAVPYTSDNLFLFDNLDMGSQVYYCTFLFANEQLTTSEVKSCSTRDISPKTGYVNLGLSCSWAACDYGAYSPASKGIQADKNTRTLGDGRVPTSSEVYELNNCPHEVIKTSDGTIRGIVVKAKNGGSGQIYIPNVKHFINRSENKPETGSIIKYSYLKRFYYSNSSFEVEEVQYLSGLSCYGYNRLVSDVSGYSGGSGDEQSSTCPDNNHPHMIDLGLPSGTKWSCCNLGATAPEKYGAYYAWGETETKNVFTWNTYKYGYYEYPSFDYSHLTNIGSDIAGTSYDAAHVNWGRTWKMPTETQVIELLNYTSYSWTTWENVKGVEFKGNNGKTLFFPAAGGYGSDSGTYYGNGIYALYWTSTLQRSDYGSTTNAYSFVGSKDYIHLDEYGHGRYYGLSVRPVAK